MSKIRVLYEDVDPSTINPKKLTQDCMTVTRADGITDIVRSYKAVDVFDFYHDLGIPVTRIERSWGTRNPKFQEPEI